jgi:hypothetical protein
MELQLVQESGLEVLRDDVRSSPDADVLVVRDGAGVGQRSFQSAGSRSGTSCRLVSAEVHVSRA